MSALEDHTIGFIGLGLMGRPMARHLSGAGAAMVVHSRSPGPVAEMEALGMRGATSPAAVARTADVCLLMLTDTPAVEQVVTGPSGLLESLQPGSLVIDMLSPLTINNETQARWGPGLDGFAEADRAEFMDSEIDVFHIAVGVGGRTFQDVYDNSLQFVAALYGHRPAGADQLLVDEGRTVTSLQVDVSQQPSIGISLFVTGHHGDFDPGHQAGEGAAGLLGEAFVSFRGVDAEQTNLFRRAVEDHPK